MWDDLSKGFIGFLFGLAAFWLQHYFFRKRSSLTANLSTFSLLSLPDAIREQVEVRFRDHPVANIMNHTITLFNSGNQVIQNHELKITSGEDSEILHVDPGPRSEVTKSDDKQARVKIRFLNPRDSTEILISTTGGNESELELDGEGPGVRFKSGERILPVIEANMTAEDLTKVFQRAARGYLRKNWRRTVLVYALFLLALGAFIYFRSLLP